MSNCVSRWHVVKVEKVASGVQSDRPSEMKQFVWLLRQTGDVERVNSVSTDNHFVVAFSSNADDADPNIDVMTVSTVD